jgi:hypothetical protein
MVYSCFFGKLAKVVHTLLKTKLRVIFTSAGIDFGFAVVVKSQQEGKEVAVTQFQPECQVIVDHMMANPYSWCHREFVSLQVSRNSLFTSNTIISYYCPAACPRNRIKLSS